MSNCTRHISGGTHVRVGIGQDLPVEPGQPTTIDLSRPVLDVGVTGRSCQYIAGGAVIVGGVEVACTPVTYRSETRITMTTTRDSPFFHYQLLSGVLCLLNVGLHGRSREIAGSVCVNRYNVQSIAGQPIGLHGLSQPGLSAGQDKDLRGMSSLEILRSHGATHAAVVSELTLDRPRTVTLPAADGSPFTARTSSHKPTIADDPQ